MTKSSKDPTPETTYRGYKIRYSENEEVWNCLDLNLSAAKLSTLKAKMAAAIKKHNDENGVPCIYFNRHGNGVRQPVVVFGIITKWETDWRAPGTGRFGEKPKVPHYVLEYYSTTEGGRSRAQKSELPQFYAPTPETDAALAEYDRLDALANAARKAADDYAKAIPHMRPEDFASLKPEEPESQEETAG